MKTVIKLILATLLILCLFHMPYGYYQAVRFIAAGGFILLGCLNYQDKKEKTIETFIYLLLALLFQPFLKITLGRVIWNVFDVLISLSLVITILLDKKSKEKHNLKGYL